MRSRPLHLIIAASAVVLGLSACSSDKKDSKNYKVTLGDFVVQANSPSPKAGKVTIEVSNKGGLTHELVVMRTSADKIKVKDDGEADEESVPEADHMGEIENLLPGKTETFTVNLTPGHYTMLCNLNEKTYVHFHKGMKAEFDVVA